MTIQNAESIIFFIATPKVPTDNLPYGFDFGQKWLNGDKIDPARITWSYTNEDGSASTDLTIVPQALNAGQTIATAKITGGVSQKNYLVYCQIYTQANVGPKTIGFRLPVV